MILRIIAQSTKEILLLSPSIHEEYFLHVYKTLFDADIKCGKISKRSRKPDSRTGNIYTGLQFHTSTTDPYWTQLRQRIFDSGGSTKIIPEQPFGLFITPMD